jgi:hypothetical protein
MPKQVVPTSTLMPNHDRKEVETSAQKDNLFVDFQKRILCSAFAFRSNPSPCWKELIELVLTDPGSVLKIPERLLLEEGLYSPRILYPLEISHLCINKDNPS